MICIKFTKTVRGVAKKGDVKRASNGEAYKLVESGKATFVSKSEWKAEGRHYLGR